MSAKVGGMVVFVNKLTLKGSAQELEKIYAGVAAFFSAQPGFLSYQFLRSESDPNVYINIAAWTDEESFRRATRQEAFRVAARVGKVSTGDPHLCSVVSSG
ncbi:antibiotic biosynthesis monooxygenase family protein [Nonomuraea insulae]|uniref:Antibiotic biosynthesis monooxygenase family protein n=1 Tax=Nonomuraea insulae TaxID=1616787 RepID=A0ABW1CRM2_9ACTN